MRAYEGDTMIRSALALAVVFAAAPAYADCDHFKWSVAAERALFSASPAPLAATDGKAEINKAYALALGKDVKPAVAPERKPKDGTSGAVVAVTDLPAGLYQITLSEEAWIDVVENGALVKSSDFSGQKDCPGIRKSVRFQLPAGPALVQIGNGEVDKLMLAIMPVK